MDVVLGPLIWLIGLVGSVLWWVIGTISWIVFWLLLPLAVVAFIALRIAEATLGQEVVRQWVKARTLKYGKAVSTSARRILFALGTLPIRVLFWFVVFAVWHSIVTLLWRPKWRPWQRAWSKRWRAPRLPPGSA